MRPGHRAAILVLVAMFALTLNVAAQSKASAALVAPLRAQVEAIADTADAVPNRHRLLSSIYAARAYLPIWTAPDRVAQLQRAIAASEREGLRPEDYAFTALRSAWEIPTVDAERAVARELLATEALLRLIVHLHFGKVDPRTLDRSWNLTRNAPDDAVIALFTAATEAADLPDYLATLPPAHRSYGQLRDALAGYRDLAAQGGWPAALGEGDTLREGMREARVVALRERLAVSDDPALVTAPDAELFDAALTAAVREFQRRHGLAVDGAVGKQTRAALNVPVDARIDQIRVNLERARWVLHHLSDAYIAVNIASFEAFLLRHGELVWRSRVVVGRTYRRTPVFRATLQYLVFNPTWTVPPTILRHDVLPKLRQDPAYLEQQRFDVLDYDGQRIDPAGIDWNTVSARATPLLLRQRSGADNALGRVKFMLPNEYDVYLHDTPQQQLFARAERTFSSGCIRVEQALELAELLLDDANEWNRAAIDAAIARGTTRTVVLRQPLEVLLLYWTAMVDSDGTLRHYPDVYGRDAALLAALNRPEAK